MMKFSKGATGCQQGQAEKQHFNKLVSRLKELNYKYSAQGSALKTQGGIYYDN